MAVQKTSKEMLNELHQVLMGIDGQQGLCTTVQQLADREDKNRINIMRLWFALILLVVILGVGGGIGVEKILTALSLIGG